MLTMIGSRLGLRKLTVCREYVLQICFELCWAVKHQRLDAITMGSPYITGHVIDEQDFGKAEVEARSQDFKKFPLGFNEARFGGCKQGIEVVSEAVLGQEPVEPTPVGACKYGKLIVFVQALEDGDQIVIEAVDVEHAVAIENNGANN